MTLTQRRLYQFRQNKRGFIAFILFMFVFVLSLFADLIANDRPLLVSYKGSFYCPIVSTYPETTFGGEFEVEAVYKDPYVKDLILGSGGWILWPLIPYRYDTVNMDLPTPAPSPPTWENLLGTDDQGRDVLARLLYGFRVSILFSFTLTALSLCMGITAGAIQGYFGGKVDLIFQRFIEIWSGMPTLYLLMILASFVQPNFWWLLGLLLLFSWMTVVGVVRAEFLRARNFEYVKAAKVLGLSTPRIIARHVLPNAMVAAITYMPFLLNGAISTLTSLDFLGFGLPLGSPSLGELLQQGKNNLHAPWLGVTAFMGTAILLSLLVFVGEAIRDAFDARRS